MSQIEIHGHRSHLKASEEYVDVTFRYKGGKKWVGSIPIKYRRTGLELTSQDDIEKHLEYCHGFCDPSKFRVWLKNQDTFWKSKQSAAITKSFFDALSNFQWCCVGCSLPKNPNWARRTQDLKEFGYTLATDTSRFCKSCDRNNTHLLLVPIPRGSVSGYETWTPATRARIVKLLGSYDVYEGKQASHILPDHKFPEIRWDTATRRAALDELTDLEIRNDFQLMTNQRNQQKREVCRLCYQTGRRGFPFGIEFFYHGESTWPATTPRVGKVAETGCEGCGWYDMEKWRQALKAKLGSD